MPGDPHELGGDLSGGQDEIDGSRDHGAVGHAGVLRRLLVLGERQAPGILDRTEADGAIGSGARKNYADRPGPMVVGQRGQEGVDGRCRPSVASREPRRRIPPFIVRLRLAE